MRRLTPVVLAGALVSTGCAAIFRDGHPKMRFDSTPSGARASVRDVDVGATPVEARVNRGGLTLVSYEKEGYQQHLGLVPKKTNAAWLVFDILLCPITICIPLIVDGASGSWNDVPRIYVARLDPLTPTPPPPQPAAPIPPPQGAPPTPPSTMSESERKATARAAYMEGVGLQDKGDCAAALVRFEAAQKLFDAPTHLLRIAQCHEQTGKLVEAQESYETLVHANLGPQSPEAFRQAQDAGRKELAALRPRVPSLRIQLTPPPPHLQGLAVQINGRPTPNELIGIARPMNPGPYKVVATAKGLRPGAADVDLKEGQQRIVEITLKK